MCTSLIITDTNGNAYHGRTIEFSGLIPSDLSYFPAGSEIESATPDGKVGATFKTQYPILGATNAVITGSKQPYISEAINDQGLSFSANALLGSSVAPVGSNHSRVLSVNDLGAWILGSFKDVTEVKNALASGDKEFWLPVLPIMGNLPMPFHYSVFDKKANGIVIEFFNGKVNVHDNPVGVMTNGLEFPWHLLNLSNYTFTNVDKNTGRIGNVKLATQDAGIALTALPSAQTSQGRFVKAAFYANYVRKAKTPDEAIITLGHIMNNFDRPYDLSVDGDGGMGDGPRSKVLSSETTDVTVMNDLSRNLYYIRTINALNWSVIDMYKLKNLPKFTSINIYDVNKVGAEAFVLGVQ